MILPGLPRCPRCGQSIIRYDGAAEICSGCVDREYGWAENNRRICDLIHRGRAPARVAVDERGWLVPDDHRLAAVTGITGDA